MSALRIRAWRAAALALAAMGAAPALACVNETGTTLSGRHVALDFGPELIHWSFTHRGPGEVAQYSDDVIERARERRDFVSLNDLAATTIRLGRPQAAERLLISLERRWPGRYETATNLGTAYELLGRNEDALRWIREGIARNPRSHWGTEWLHVRILEAKVAAAGAPLSPDASLAGLDFGDATTPVRPRTLPAGNDGAPVDPWGLAQGLRIQLHERIGLVAPPDPVVASLLLDLAALEMAVGSVENANLVYARAIEYGATETPLVAARRATIAAAMARAADASDEEGAHGTCEICSPPVDDAEEG